MKKVVVFGSSGSIGSNALRIIRQCPGKYEVIGIAVRDNIAAAKEQIKDFSPRYAVVFDESKTGMLKNTAGSSTAVLSGREGLLRLADIPSDIAVVGINGIEAIPLLSRLVKSTKRIVLANKECLVVAGKFIMPLIRKSGVEFFPADSEMFALSLLLESAPRSDIEAVYITASGGALRDWTVEQRESARVEDVLKHPTWNMGKKITVDSATLVNKAFEVVEASWLFDLDVDAIRVLLHKESFIHAGVTLKNQVTQSCVFSPDMRIPLAYGICYPESARVSGSSAQAWIDTGALSMTRLKKGMFPCFDSIIRCASKSRDALVSINAANDVLVDCFLRGVIRFKHIYAALQQVVRAFPVTACRRLEDVMDVDREVREYTRKAVQNRYA